MRAPRGEDASGFHEGGPYEFHKDYPGDRRTRLFVAGGPLAVRAADISGAGATFPYPIYAKWADAYKKETGIGLNYQSIGSGGGIKQIKAKTVTFGASDAPLTGKDLDEVGPRPVPDGHGRHRAGREPRGRQAGRARARRPDARQDLPRRDQEVERPGDREAQSRASSCPSQAIAVVHRSDGSGTTFNFTNYLSEVSPDWKSKVGANTAVQWPAGIGAKGNEGVANNVAQTKGSIGYVEYAYAKQNKLDLRQDGQQGRQDRRADRRGLPGRRRQRRLEVAAGLRRDPRQPARRHSPGRSPAPTFILHLQAAGRIRRRRPRRSSSSPGPTPRATRWPRSSTTCRCPTTSSSDIEKMWAAEIKDAAASRSTRLDAVTRRKRRRRRPALSRRERPSVRRPAIGGVRWPTWP